MTILPPSTSVDRIYNLISTIANLIALVISLVLLCLIHLNFIRKKISAEVSVILSINTLCLILTRSILQFIDVDLNTIKRNYLSMMEYENSFICQFRGYLLLSIHVALYWSYALHAFFRFTRVIFPKSIRLHQLSMYLYVLIPCQFLLGYICTFPIFRGFNALYLLPNEPYCTASYNELASLIYMPIVAFVLPLSVISICYTYILWKTTHSGTLIRPYQQRNRRDCLVLRRIIITIVVISMVSLPLLIDLFIYLPKGYTDPYMNSIGWLSSSVNAVILAISLPFINPRILELFRKKSRIHILAQAKEIRF